VRPEESFDVGHTIKDVAAASLGQRVGLEPGDSRLIKPTAQSCPAGERVEEGWEKCLAELV